MSIRSPQQSTLYWVDLNPTRGHEQRGTRPCLIVSPDWLNQGTSGLVFAVPLTTRQKDIPSHVRLDPPMGDLKKTSYIMPEQLRVISTGRLKGQIGSVPEDVLDEVRYHLRMLLDL